MFNLKEGFCREEGVSLHGIVHSTDSTSPFCNPIPHSEIPGNNNKFQASFHKKLLDRGSFVFSRRDVFLIYFCSNQISFTLSLIHTNIAIMKISAIHVGLCAIIPHLAFAGQPKQWEYQRRVFERQSVGNLSTTDSGNGNGNGNTKITDSFNSYTNNGVINNGEYH